MGFFGLYGSTAAIATTLTLAAAVNCIGIGFQRGTHTNWQLVCQRRSKIRPQGGAKPGHFRLGRDRLVSGGRADSVEHGEGERVAEHT